jgi:hypothetical protein
MRMGLPDRGERRLSARNVAVLVVAIRTQENMKSPGSGDFVCFQNSRSVNGQF